MSVSKKNNGLLLVAILLLLVMFAIVVSVAMTTGILSVEPHFAAHCAGSTCGIG